MLLLCLVPVGQDLIDQGDKVQSGFAIRRVCDNAFAVCGCLGQHAALADLGIEYFRAELLGDLLGQLQYVAVEVKTRIKFVKQNANNLQTWVVILPHGFDGFLNLRDAEQAEDFRRHWDDQLI